jgi:hypothetical protein
MKKYLCFPLFCILCSSCTVTISQTATDTHGYANDIVDETQKTESELDADANVSLPLTAIKEFI